MKTIISKASTFIANLGPVYYNALIKKINIRYPGTKIEEKPNRVIKIYLNSTRIKIALNDVIMEEATR